jgi:transglutaminase-like putative cysteine protease
VDPTNGIWMAGDHIVIAIGRDYSEIAPIDGVFLGTGVQTMTVSVDVAPEDEQLSVAAPALT